MTESEQSTGHDSDHLVRLARLEEVFLNISEADTEGGINKHSMRYVQHGDGLRLILNEILELRGPSPEDLRLDGLRQAYIQTLFIKAGLLTPTQRAAYDERSDTLQQEYVDAVVSKVADVIDAYTPREALELCQLPPIVRKASFVEEHPVDMEQFTANHLYLLVDTALKEHVKRRQLIDERRNKSLLSRVSSSRGARIAIGGAIGAASLAPELSFVPRPEEIITHDLELGLRGLSGAIIGINLPEYIRLKYLSNKHEKQSRDNLDRLSNGHRLCDWAMRIVYGSARRGGTETETMVTGRYATDDKAENLRRLIAIDENFPHLNNDPGGKPYSARQALDYAARLLIERRDQVTHIIDPSLPAEEQRRLFLDLCKQVITEDARRMKKGLNVTKIRRAAVGSLGVLPAILFPSATDAASNATTLGRDTLETIKTKHFKEEDN